MIQVGTADQSSGSSLETIVELHEQLSFHIGAIISLEIDLQRERRLKEKISDIQGQIYGANGGLIAKRTVTTGRLERVKLTEGKPGSLSFGYCFEGDSAIREDLYLDSARVKVLLDGSWKLIHEPESWRAAEEEDATAAELKRLAITPLSQWTEDERQRYGKPSALGVPFG